MAELPLYTLALFYLIIFAAGIVHGSLGMGFPMIATPLLALFVDLQSAILMTLLPTVSVNIFSILRGGDWNKSLAKFWPLGIYAIVGSGIGTLLIINNDPRPFKLFLALLILLYMGSHWLGRLRMEWIGRYRGWSMLIFGTTAGIAAGSTNVMVPVLIIYTLGMGLTTTVLVQVFNMCFLAGKMTQIVIFSGAGELNTQLLLATSPLAGVALIALFLGMAIRSHITSGSYTIIIKGILLITALILIAQYYLGH